MLYVKGSDTSEAAAVSMNGGKVALRQRVLDFVKAQTGGVTCDEVELALDLRHQTASARVKELLDDELIADSGERRRTRSGRTARVYFA